MGVYQNPASRALVHFVDTGKSATSGTVFVFREKGGKEGYAAGIAVSMRASWYSSGAKHICYLH